MNRTGLLIALSIAGLVGLLFGFYPDLDVIVSQPFFDAMPRDEEFGLRMAPVIPFVRDVAWGVIAGLVAFVSLGLMVKLVRPRMRLLMTTRSMAFLLVTFLLGPVLLVNATLKDQWGRPRPSHVVEFDGSQKFVAWWDTGGECRQNCSFVSGDVAAVTWTVALAAIAPPAWRVAAYGASMAVVAAAALFRVATGAHFLTDVVFAALLMFVTIWLMHGLMIRWPRTRLTEGEADDAIAEIVPWWRAVLRDLFRRPRTDP